MRRLLLLLVLLLVLGTVLYVALGGGAASATQAVVAVARSSLEAQRSGAAFEPVYDGDSVAVGDEVRADGSGRGFVAFFDGSTIAVDPGARVTVSELKTNADGSTIVRLQQALGRTWSSVRKFANPASRYEIQTSAGVAIVRGTGFYLTVQPDGTMVVRTVDGAVVVSAQGVEQVATANTQVTVVPGQPPSAPQAVPPGPSLRFSAPGGIALVVFEPNDLACGAGRADAPGCIEASVALRDVTAGTYTILLAATGTVNANLVMEGQFGTSTVSTQALTRALNPGDMVRTTVRVTLDAQGRPTLAPPTPFEAVSSVCAAEARGRTFASGALEERTAALLQYAATNRGQPASIVIGDAELTAALQKGVEGLEGLPAKVSNLRARTTLAGTELAADVSLGPLNVAGRIVVVARSDAGRIVLRLKSLELGPVPGPIVDQVRDRIGGLLREAGGDLPLVVQRVLFRAGCVGLVGTAR